MIRVKKKLIRSIVFFSLLNMLIIGVTYSLGNPAAIYCNEMGYDFLIKETSEGEIGICKFPDGSSCEDWDFLQGRCGIEHSYCKKRGYDVKKVSDPEKCGSTSNEEECTVCILENGTEIEVTKLMRLSFGDIICGDGFCVFGENYNNCREDCPSGTMDDYCDRVKDSICDPDCFPGVDLDCEKLEEGKKSPPSEGFNVFLLYVVGFFLIILIFVVVFIFYKKSKQKDEHDELEELEGKISEMGRKMR